MHGLFIVVRCRSDMCNSCMPWVYWSPPTWSLILTVYGCLKNCTKITETHWPCSMEAPSWSIASKLIGKLLLGLHRAMT